MIKPHSSTRNIPSVKDNAIISVTLALAIMEADAVVDTHAAVVES